MSNETEIKYHPILFSADMVRAILEDRKTMTRRTKSRNYKPGDRLWIREAWVTEAQYNVLPPRDVPKSARVHYLADGPAPDWAGRYRHGRFMPRCFSRITREVTACREEPLQDISEADAIAEGVEQTRIGFRDYELPANVMHGVPAEYSFQSLWQSINGETPGHTWEDNPTVTVISFKVIDPTTTRPTLPGDAQRVTEAIERAGAIRTTAGGEA